MERVLKMYQGPKEIQLTLRNTLHIYPIAMIFQLNFETIFSFKFQDLILEHFLRNTFRLFHLEHIMHHHLEPSHFINRLKVIALSST
jgi:hypothetical protein